jgi:hypothetical protein
MDYSWKILYIKTKNYAGMPKSLYSCRIEYIGTDENGNTGIHDMLMTFPEPTLETYIPYEELSEQKIVEMFADMITEEHWDHMRSNIDREISDGVIKQSSLPWS